MKAYTRIYIAFFKFDISDFIPCELCGQKSVDINHIDARGMGGKGNKKAQAESDDITNLMATCRKHHDQYADKEQYKGWLKAIHIKYMETKQPFKIN